MTLPGAPVARMLNTCSIGRRWKSREGWSRPVLTGERGTLFPTPWGSGLVLWWFSRWMARNAVSCGHDDAGKAFDLLASVVRFPDRHDRNRGMVPLPAAGFPVGRYIGFAVVMAQVRRPVPFRTRKLRPGTAMVLHSRGCGRVARRRIQLMDLPVEPHRGSRKVLFYSRARVSSSIRWRETDAGRPVGGRIVPVSGGIGTTADSTRRGVSDD